MQSNFRQHITSMVKDIIPLGVPLRHRVDDGGRAHPLPQCTSQETNKNHTYPPKPFNPLLKHTSSPQKIVLERRNKSAVTFPSGSTKVCTGVQESLSTHSVRMRKVQFDNNSSHHLNNDRACQSVGKKDALLQRQDSYNEQKEFALAFCKQLNENLKVGRPGPQTGNAQHKMSSVHPPIISSSMSKSQKASAPQKLQQSQGSFEKMDKSIDLDHSLSLVTQGVHMHQQATTPAGARSLSLKRRRESSAERHQEGKRLCLDEVGLTPSSTSGSGSSFSSSPKFIKRAFVKRVNEPVLTLNESCSPTLHNPTGDKIKASNNVAKQLFQEPRTERNKLQTAALSTMIDGTGHQKEEMRSSTENKCLIGNSATANPRFSFSSRLNQQNKEEGSRISSDLINRSEISCPLQQPKDTSLSSINVMGSHNSKTTNKATKKEKKRDLVWKDPLDLELGEDVEVESCVLSLSSSHSGEEDHLLSLQEILERSTCVHATPEKMTFSEPSTPGPKVAPEDLKSKPTSYKNTLEQMLKEKELNRKSKELEMQLLQACEEDLLKLEEEDENAEGLSLEQREFLQRFSVTSCVIRDIHPGEEVFTLTNTGRLFNHESLNLRKIGVTPNNRAQQTLLQVHSEQFLPLLSAGLLRRAYSSSPCQPQVTRWLFQMISVHPNPIVCAQILEAMTTIALSAAQQIVEKSNKKFEVWVPSLQDIALVFLNMGVSFVSLFPLEDLQPTFTEGDLLESLEIQPDGTRTEKDGSTFPVHNFENIIKYVALCLALCPRMYSDEELLLMLTLICRVSLETRLQLLPTGDLSCLLQHLLNNMTNWEIQLPQVCQAITNLSEDHHNLRRLVQQLPHSVRGKQLRRHVSMSIISKLLNHRCTYTPSCTEFQLSHLRCYLPRMRPSLLLKGLMASKTSEAQETDDCSTTPDQQAYYLCYSLLALTNEASNFEFLPSKQRNELLLLSAELEKHVKCDIRESEKMLYRSKVKDFVARIYTKWQVLLQRSRPQEGKLYDYWKPLPEDKMLTKKSPQSTEQEDTEESLSVQSDIQSDKEEYMEENDDIPEETEEKLQDADENIQKNVVELQEVLADVKERQILINLDDKDAEGTKDDDMAIDEELLGGSSEGSVKSDEDEDLIKREDELLNDDESLDRHGDLVGGENKESEDFGKVVEELLVDDACLNRKGDFVEGENYESEDFGKREKSLLKGDESLDMLVMLEQKMLNVRN